MAIDQVEPGTQQLQVQGRIVIIIDQSLALLIKRQAEAQVVVLAIRHEVVLAAGLAIHHQGLVQAAHQGHHLTIALNAHQAVGKNR